MNYITEINRFYDWLETNPVSDSSIVLWHALMNINNKCGWKPQFAVAISSIQNKTGLSKSSILRARNLLQQAGRIIFVTRNGQLSTVYTLISFQGDTQSEAQKKIVVHTDTQSGAQSGAQSGTQSEAQTVTIPKLKETKLNKEESGGEPPPIKSFKKFSEEDFVEELRKFKDDFPKEMLNAFFKYWKEKTASGRMRFQTEKTWETKLRLGRWQSNQKNETNGSNQGTSGKTIPTGRTIVRDQL